MHKIRDLALDCGTEDQIVAALTRLFAGRTPTMVGLGEPTHGVAAFPQFRNEVLAALVEHHGFRAIAIESDCLAATAVDDYVCEGVGDLDDTLAKGFSHGLGGSEANRELVAWIRDYNSSVDAAERVRFYGFDGPLEMMSAASPRMPLTPLLDFLASRLGAPRIARLTKILDGLIGADENWTSADAMMDAARSVGDSADARALRLAVDDLIGVLAAERPGLSRASSALELERLDLYLRTAQWLLRYHAVAATPAPPADRTSAMLGQRDAMMAANLLAIAAAQAQRGPVLVFAQSAHLQRHPAEWRLAGMHLRWWSAGAMVASVLEDRYLHIAADLADGTTVPGSLQSVLAEATSRRALFPAAELAAAVEGQEIVRGESADPGYFPIQATELDYLDAVAFLNE